MMFAFLVLVAGVAGAIDAAGAERVMGARFDAAPFAEVIQDEGGNPVGLQWDEPRKIRELVVTFAEGAALPTPDAIRIEYWHGVWDGGPDPVLIDSGACGQGWWATDDWTNGQWKTAVARMSINGRSWSIAFASTGDSEFPEIGEKGVTFRRTLKVRLAGEPSLPRVERLQAFTDSVCRPLTVRLHFGKPGKEGAGPRGDERGRLEIHNGSIRAVRAVPAAAAVVAEDGSWTLPAGAEGAVEADLTMAVDPLDGRYDRTIVTVRSAGRPFSFAADEVARGDRILVDDLGVLVVRGDDGATLDGWRAMLKEYPTRAVYDRVFDESEQTLMRAWNDMPLKRPLYFVHGLPGNRNTMRQEPDGGIVITSEPRWFDLPRSEKDTTRKNWPGSGLCLRFGFPGPDRRGGRELAEGYLPVLRTWWQEGPLLYEQWTVLDALSGPLESVRVDDPSALLVRIRIVNTSDQVPATASLTLTSEPFDKPRETLAMHGDVVSAVTPEGERVRVVLPAADASAWAAGDAELRWTRKLGPGESHTLHAMVPSVTLAGEAEVESLRKRDFMEDAARICDFWTERTAAGTQIETPEPWLNDFYRAHVRHLLINCQGEVDSGRLHAHVGSFYYGDFPNEAIMMISDLDRRGYADVARRCLDSYLDAQGTVPLPGNFAGAEGMFYGSGGHEMGGYNKSHGYVCWGMAEHWWYTRDREWMARAAPRLVAACEWIIRERQATQKMKSGDVRPIEYGFLPAGGLEDVQDYWYWLATNAATAWGFEALAAALADYGHPEAERLMREAHAYRQDVMQGLTESRIRTPVVRLRDGTYVPKYPSHLHLRGRALGWIRETLEGPMFLLYYGLIPPDAPEATWILKDYEDNLYISDRYGYSIPVFDRFWFSRGGFSMQANLLDGPPPYLWRDEVKHYLRAYFNAFASAFYPDVRMCNEHSAPELGYPAGDHFKTSDEAQSTFWLRLMFVREDGPDLYLGQAIPRYWLADGQMSAIRRAATHFGPLSLTLKSRAGAGEIEASLTPPTRTPPKRIFLRLRHPDTKPIRGVTVNGQPWTGFDPQKEWIELPGTLDGEQTIVATY